MKSLSFIAKKIFLKNSLKFATIFLVGATQFCESSLAQTSNTPAAVQIFNTATYSYTDPTGKTFTGSSSQLQAELIDPFGRVTACDGSLLPDYLGFSVGLYESLNSTGDIGLPLLLTGTVPPSQASATKFAGLSPNLFNANPFFLTNSDQGKFNFLLDVNRGQVDVGREFILYVKPPANSSLNERRIRVKINSRVGSIVNYTAAALDGQPISASNGATSVDGKIDISDAATVGLNLAVINLSVAGCQSQAVQLVKTGDRAAAEPGDIVIYRLTVRNLANTALVDTEIRDDLPLGFQYIEGSVKAEFGGTLVPVTLTQNGRNLIFKPSISLPDASDSRTLNIVYATQLTNDALRGTGINRATVSGVRSDNAAQVVRDGPVSHRLRIRPGILSDCGTLIGRVFVDKNFDGEQQAGEPGVPNAVIYMDDGNRIVTDANGLYSLSSVLSGSRTLAIDLTSTAGYTLAPNLYFIERNSQSRLVKLAPGGLYRVNFAVTPVGRGLSSTKQEGSK